MSTFEISPVLPESTVIAQFGIDRLSKLVISAFIIWHCLAIAFWNCPSIDPERKFYNAPIRYLHFFGLWQYWRLFAPNPQTYNLYLSANIIFVNGEETNWIFPRAENSPVFVRSWKDKYRKWAHDSVLSNKTVMPDAARWIARLHSKDGRIPIEVTLIEHWSNIPPPSEGLRKPCATNPEHQKAFFTYTVSKEDLL